MRFVWRLVHQEHHPRVGLGGKRQQGDRALVQGGHHIVAARLRGLGVREARGRLN